MTGNSKGGSVTISEPSHGATATPASYYYNATKILLLATRLSASWPTTVISAIPTGLGPRLGTLACPAGAPNGRLPLGSSERAVQGRVLIL